MFDKKLIVGVVNPEERKSFILKRQELWSKKPNYEKYFKSNATTIRTLVIMFIQNSDAITEFVETMEAKNGKRIDT